MGDISILAACGIAVLTFVGGGLIGFGFSTIFFTDTINYGVFANTYDEDCEAKIASLEDKVSLLEEELSHVKAQSRTLKGWVTRLRKKK